jgi:hypothetical protein
MTHLVDAKRLVDVFAETDARMPLLVFALLSIYFDEGPFRFDAAALAERLSNLNLKARVNAEELASLQPHLERFFDPTPEGWVPRRGVLLFEGELASPAHPGSAPGDLAPRH